MGDCYFKRQEVSLSEVEVVLLPSDIQDLSTLKTLNNSIFIM